MTRSSPPCTAADGSLYCSNAARKLPDDEAVLELAAVDPGVCLVGIGVGGKEEEVLDLGVFTRGVAIAEVEAEAGGEVALRKLGDAPGGTVANCAGASCGRPIG